jgi:hypothetical protein
MCRYRHCYRTQKANLHGNSRYCSYECYYGEKKERNKDLYKKNSQILSSMKETESSLASLYNLYDGKPVPYETLNKFEISWGFSSDIKEIDGMNYRIIGNYGYVRLANKTLKIIKIK